MNTPEAPIIIDPQVQGGEPCLAGTRIPACVLVQRWLEHGNETPARFCQEYTSVSIDQAQRALDWLREAILTYMLGGRKLERAIGKALTRASKEKP